MTSNTQFYFDSSDAQSMGLSVSNDYDFLFIASLPFPLEEGLEESKSLDMQNDMMRLIRQSDSAGLVITDNLYYRFLLSVTMAFSMSGHAEVSSLLLSSAEQVFESLKRDDVRLLLNNPDASKVEETLGKIVIAASAQNEELAIQISAKYKNILNALWGETPDAVLSNFPKSEKMVIPFSLHANRSKFSEVIKDGEILTVANEMSAIKNIFPDITISVGDEGLFKSAFQFCDSVCTIFSALFVDGVESEELDETYKRIWSFILRTHSSCFVPKSAFEKARAVLL